MTMRSLFAELRRRNVLRAAVLYVGAVWAFGQGLSQFSPAIGLPDWATRWFLAAAAIGFPFWIAFAWFFEFTPEGLKRESEIDPVDSITAHTSRKLDFAIIGVLAVAVVLLLTDRFVLRHGVNEATGVAISDQSIAVLPFADMSQAHDQEYFSDGISEELLNLLAKIPQLHVAARTSSFSFKGREVAIPEIAKTLLVANVLEGSIRKAGDQVRITAQLIRAADGYQIWSNTWDRKLDDIFKIQDEIAGEVVKQLKVTLLGAVPKVRTTDPNAYALYLQAVQLGRQTTAEAFAKSDDLYKQVLAIDPNYAPAWDGLSWNYTHETNIGVLSNEDGFARAREAVQKALAIDPDYAPAHASLGYIASGDNDFNAAAKHFERAVALDPGNPDVLGNSATLLDKLGRLDEGLVLEEAVVRHDPLNVTARFNMAITQRYAGKLDAAIASYESVLSLSPGRGGTNSELGVALLLKGDAAAALAAIEKETSDPNRMIGLPMPYHALGRKADSDKALAELIAKYEKDAPFNIAYVYAFRGEADKAFEWLDKAVQYQDPGLSEIVLENLFDTIRKDPRWLPFLRKIGKDPATLAKIQFKVTLPSEWQAEAAAARASLSPPASTTPAESK